MIKDDSISDPTTVTVHAPFELTSHAVEIADDTSWQETQPVRVLPIAFQAPQIKCVSFQFAAAASWRTASAVNTTSATEDSLSSKQITSQRQSVASEKTSVQPFVPRTTSGESKITRMRPPGDLVRLEDRLFYVLQPPLESIVATARFAFPFQPFPYQMEGIAFLFPRAAAILADEMGLGKTMQAITTIRMLLLAGELDRVLLICPKPLVTNWVREFSLWAPEIPIAVIEGDQAKRTLGWQHPTAPVRIANYELLMRDNHLIEDGHMEFDLVVLDEAQRIKNRNSSTSEIVRSIPRARSWALTGTPIENSIEDLVSIFEFLAPGYLRDDMQLKSLGKATADYILRRTKDKVLTEMPPKMYRDAELDLTADQWVSYRNAEDEGVIKLADMKEELTIRKQVQAASSKD
jgi:SNF2 family DNA or RNA helicase